MGIRLGIGAALAGSALAAGVLLAPPAGAAQTTQQITCGGETLTVRANTNNSSDNGGWSAAHVSGGGHLIPTSFSFSAFDNTLNTELFTFTQQKGGGNANQNQPSISCSQSMTGMLGDLLEPGEEPPPGASLTDIVTTTFVVTAVPKG